MDYEERVCFAVTLPPPLSLRERLPTAILQRENARNLQHWPQLGDVSRRLLSRLPCAFDYCSRSRPASGLTAILPWLCLDAAGNVDWRCRRLRLRPRRRISICADRKLLRDYSRRLNGSCWHEADVLAIDQPKCEGRPIGKAAFLIRCFQETCHVVKA